MRINPVAQSHGISEDIAAAADVAADYLKALASAPRLRILCALMEGERMVSEIVAAVGASDSAVSQHLSVLRREGVVAARRQGQTIRYRLARGPARRILGALYAAFCAPAPLKPRQRTDA